MNGRHVNVILFLCTFILFVLFVLVVNKALLVMGD
jgi:hypothetical protein